MPTCALSNWGQAVKNISVAIRGMLTVSITVLVLTLVCLSPAYSKGGKIIKNATHSGSEEKVFRFPPSFAGPSEFQVSLYGWITDADGDVKLRGRSAPVDEDLGEFGAVEGRFEARKGDLALFLETNYTKYAEDLGVLEYDFERVMAEFGAGLRLVKLALGDKQGFSSESRVPALSFEVLTGGRYTYSKIELDLSIGPNLKKSRDWFDLLVGGRFKLDLSKKLSLKIRGDAAGFGIGSGTELTWYFRSMLAYRPWRFISLDVGYRIYDTDWKRGSTKLDIRFKGPELGLSFYF